MSDKRSPVKAFSLIKTKGQLKNVIETGFHFLPKLSSESAWENAQDCLSVCENWQGKQDNQLQPCLLQSQSPEDCTHFFHPVSFEIKHSYYTDNLHWISDNSEQAPIQPI